MGEFTEKIKYIKSTDPGFPERLKNHAGMPKELYYIGRLPNDDIPSVAIVGARQCSIYGRIQAFNYAKAFSNAGIQVISGLAYGIDAEGHKGALEGSGDTYAVLGSGADRCYPKANQQLYRRIASGRGGILSEYPPGTPPIGFHFPIRNRIISALSDIVLVVEAKEKSGSLITVNYALEQGKTVYAVPGAVNDMLSRGCHKLIFDGAGIAYCPEVIISELGLETKNGESKIEKKNFGLERDLDMVYSCLDLRPKGLDEIMDVTGFSSQEVHRIVLELMLMGYAEEIGRHHYIRLK